MCSEGAAYSHKLKYAYVGIVFRPKTTLGDTPSDSSIEAMITRIRGSLEKKPGKGLSDTEHSSLPKAAVCMVLKPDATTNQLLVLLLKRKVSDSDPWSGHMAFPGGRANSADLDLANTAYREVMEETSIDFRKCELLGTLDDLLPGNRLLGVKPFVLLGPASIEVKIDGREIADYVWIPLDFFMDKKNSSKLQLQSFGINHEVASFAYLGSHVIWGMTLRIIEDFLSKIQ